MLLHSIGRNSVPGVTNAWIRKYIFPGGYIPSLSEVLPAIERAGLLVTDIEILRLHYAETLRAWRERFVAHGTRRRRSYASGSAGCGSSISRARRRRSASTATWCSRSSSPSAKTAVPLTRDYIGEREDALRRREAAARPMLREAAE